MFRTYEPGGNIKLIGKTLSKLAKATPQGLYVCVGDVIYTEEQDFLKGHGTQLMPDGQLVATVCGVVVRVNKLITVTPVKTRYAAAVGDVVVGRVTEIMSKKWKVELNSQQEASLQLSAVDLPGGAQRRRTAEDELNMRSMFREGDLVSAEVQGIYKDGSVQLHTRSQKYGKLWLGQLVEVPSQLVKRQKQHFKTLDQLGVDLILGLNGSIWVCPHVARGDDGAPLQKPSAAAAAAGVDRAQREACVRVAGAIRALAALYLPVFPDAIMDTYQVSLEAQVAVKDMTEKKFLEVLASSEVLRRAAAATAQTGAY